VCPDSLPKARIDSTRLPYPLVRPPKKKDEFWNRNKLERGTIDDEGLMSFYRTCQLVDPGSPEILILYPFLGAGGRGGPRSLEYLPNPIQSIQPCSFGRRKEIGDGVEVDVRVICVSFAGIARRLDDQSILIQSVRVHIVENDDVEIGRRKDIPITHKVLPVKITNHIFCILSFL